MPKIKLTSNINLSKYQASSPVYLWDTVTRGFGIKVNPSGKHKYIVMFREFESKRQKMIQLGLFLNTSINDARKSAKLQLAERFVPEKKSKVTIKSLLDEYVERRNLKQSTIDDMRIIVNRFFDTNTDISKIDNDFVEKWYLSGQNQKRKTSTDKAKRYMSTMFKYATAKKLIDANPFTIISDLKISYPQKAREGYLDENEILTFLGAMKGSNSSCTTLDMIKLYLLTGIRKNELYKAQVQGDFIFIPDTKNGKDLLIPRNKHLDRLVYLFDLDLPWSICKTLTHLSKSVDKNITIHTLRHTFISLCAHLEIQPSVISRCVNHSSRSITESVYTHRKFDSQVDQAFKAVSLYLEAAL